MSFCCGASMIGTRGTLKHMHTSLKNVPLLFCPVCKRSEVHHLIRSEFEILAEYATGEGIPEVNFSDYIRGKKLEDLFENCSSREQEDPLQLLTSQIDMSLDLLMVAKDMQDRHWERQLYERLQVLSYQREKQAVRRSAD
ncbi:hypothetical protein [Gorillibacterium massiliense]|uniref:hypothetical protein n=1 Tax=Gorillibacterium massiliense TaxID=1280390 RepID=UPI0005943F68|nr:hypothetical protein [Gorillibacterium massiliense]